MGLIKIFIPFLCGLLFRLGGSGKYPFLFVPGWSNKLWRWLMGIPIAVYGVILQHSWVPLLCTATYVVATNVISYGDNHPFRKWFGWTGQMLIYGFCFGLASMPVLGIAGALLQAVVSALAFWGLMLWGKYGIVLEEKEEDHGRLGWTLNLDQKWIEVLTGIIGTSLFWFKS